MKRSNFIFFFVAITCVVISSCKNGFIRQGTTQENEAQVLTHEDSVKMKQDSLRKKTKEMFEKSCRWIKNTADSIGFVYDKKGQESFRKSFNNKMVNDKYFFCTMLRLGEASESATNEPRCLNCEFSNSLYEPGEIGTFEGNDGTKGVLVIKRFICKITNLKEKDYNGNNFLEFSYQIAGICLNTNPKHIEWTNSIHLKLTEDRWDKTWSDMSVRDYETLKCGEFLSGVEHNSKK